LNALDAPMVPVRSSDHWISRASDENLFRRDQAGRPRLARKSAGTRQAIQQNRIEPCLAATTVISNDVRDHDCPRRIGCLFLDIQG
jgi:hypothetical protein